RYGAVSVPATTMHNRSWDMLKPRHRRNLIVLPTAAARSRPQPVKSDKSGISPLWRQTISTRVAAGKAAFLAAYVTEGSIAAAARKVGINRDTVYAWRDADPAFRAQLESGGDAYETQMDLVEAAVYKRALKGSVKEALAWLRARRPEVW